MWLRPSRRHMFPVHLGLSARSPAAGSPPRPDAPAHGQQPSSDAVTPDMATPPPPRKVSVFMGRETLVDREEVDRIRHSVELDEGALTDAALQRQVETSFDGDATDGSASPPAPAAAPKGKEWEIERIFDSCIDADSLTHFYLVKWKGFDAKHNTWEPKKNLDKCADAIVAYERSQRARG